MEILDRLRSQGVAPNSLCVDSRRIERGDVFLAYPGAAADGRRHIADAVAKGAAAVLCEAGDGATDGVTVPAVAVPHLAAMAGAIAHLVYGRPSEKLGLFGVTGTNGWAQTTTSTANSVVDSALSSIDSALTSVRSRASTFGTNASMLTIRQDFTASLVNTLKGGASNLVNADMNEESANMLALQTRQQLGTISLSIAQQSEQAVLRLF